MLFLSCQVSIVVLLLSQVVTPYHYNRYAFLSLYGHTHYHHHYTIHHQCNKSTLSFFDTFSTGSFVFKLVSNIFFWWAFLDRLFITLLHSYYVWLSFFRSIPSYHYTQSQYTSIEISSLFWFQDNTGNPNFPRTWYLWWCLSCGHTLSNNQFFIPNFYLCNSIPFNSALTICLSLRGIFLWLEDHHCF